MIKDRIIGRNDIFLSLGILFLATFGYFFFVANYVLYFQETQSLFVFSADYFEKYTLKPGGLLEYAGRFLTQFYADKLTGSLIISIVLLFPGVLIYLISGRINQKNPFSLILILFPSSLMILMQANYYHLMEYNIGIILILAYYYYSILSASKFYKILVLLMWPLFYYLAGAYALIFVVMYLVHNLILVKGRQSAIHAFILVAIAAATFLVFWKIIFLQPIEHILFFPLPLLENTIYKSTFMFLAGFIVLYPVIISSDILKRYIWLNRRIYRYMSFILVLITVVFILVKIYNPQTARVVELERLIFNEKWENAVSYHEKKPARNLIGVYFFNIALSESGQLCDRLFYGNQDFGSGSLVLPWGDEHLNRGGYFYYTVGLANEAQRWAYEEMVVYGYRPQNIKLLAKTSLINGDYRMAVKYLEILKKTIYYHDLATRYSKIADNPELLNADPELSGKRKILPRSSFFIQFNEPQNNLPLLLSSQPDNRKAFEYYIAGLLLTKNVEGVVNSVGKMKEAGYMRIPRHIEEAILIYYNSTKKYPDLGGLEISSETQERFRQYFSAFVEARKNSLTLKETMQKKFGNTFWYYYHFK